MHVSRRSFNKNTRRIQPDLLAALIIFSRFNGSISFYLANHRCFKGRILNLRKLTLLLDGWLALQSQIFSKIALATWSVLFLKNGHCYYCYKSVVFCSFYQALPFVEPACLLIQRCRRPDCLEAQCEFIRFQAKIDLI